MQHHHILEYYYHLTVLALPRALTHTLTLTLPLPYPYPSKLHDVGQAAAHILHHEPSKTHGLHGKRRRAALTEGAFPQSAEAPASGGGASAGNSSGSGDPSSSSGTGEGKTMGTHLKIGTLKITLMSMSMTLSRH